MIFLLYFCCKLQFSAIIAAAPLRFVFLFVFFSLFNRVLKYPTYHSAYNYIHIRLLPVLSSLYFHNLSMFTQWVMCLCVCVYVGVSFFVYVSWARSQRHITYQQLLQSWREGKETTQTATGNNYNINNIKLYFFSIYHFQF